jgi:hypothetical protein
MGRTRLTPLMRHLLASLAAIVVVATGCSSVPGPPVSSSFVNASVTYTGAWSAAGFGIALAPQGTASAWISGTTTLSMKVYANGQSYRAIDGVGPDAKATTGKLRKCGCLVDVTVERGLSTDPHIVTIRNMATRLQLIIKGWTIDAGGSFRRTAVLDASLKGTVTPASPLSFYVQQTSLVAVDYVPSGAILDIHVDDRPDGYRVVTHAAVGSGIALSRAVISWGLAGGLHKLTIDVSSGSLSLRDVVMFQAPRKGTPRVVPDDLAARGEILGVYGDAIGAGQSSLGPLKDSDGFPDRLAALRGWRLTDPSSVDSSASCYGVDHVGDVIAPRPNTIILAFGSSDMIPGPDALGCDPTMDQFGSAIDSILGQIQTRLPGVPLFVQAILPTVGVPEATRTAYNDLLKKKAEDRGARFVDVSSKLSSATDYAGLYPNNLGAQAIADAWNSLLPTG